VGTLGRRFLTQRPARAAGGGTLGEGDCSRGNVVTRRQPPSLEEVEALAGQLRAMVGEVRAQSAQREASLEQDVRELTDLLRASERHASQVSNLYVATYQLHASLELAQVQAAICEIAINLIGVDQYALLVRDPERDVIDIVSRSDEPAPALAGEQYKGGDAMVDAVLGDGQIRLGAMEGSAVEAAVPLAMEGNVLGVLVIQRLLPQKGSFAPEDRELLDVLGAHAASALFAARLFHERTRKLRTLEGLMGLLRPGKP
jgi:GAF domain-containing protein